MYSALKQIHSYAMNSGFQNELNLFLYFVEFLFIYKSCNIFGEDN